MVFETMQSSEHVDNYCVFMLKTIILIFMTVRTSNTKNSRAAIYCSYICLTDTRCQYGVYLLLYDVYIFNNFFFLTKLMVFYPIFE